jgi:Arylsulfotransferase (ASST)
MNIPSIVVLCCVSLLVGPGGALAQTIYPTGTTIYQEGVAYDGLTFYPAFDQRAKLIDMRGTLVHEWWLPVSGDIPFSPLYEPIPESPGHIFALETTRLSELDWDSNVVWQFVAPVALGVGDLAHGVEFHHDVVRRANGNTLILCSVLIQVPTISPKLLRDDCILEVTPAGQIVWQWFTFQHVDEFGLTADARQLIAEARNGGDWAHANALSEIPPNHHRDPAFTPGNLLVSYRELNAMIIIDKATGAIVGKVGPHDNLTIGQHQPEMIPPDLPGAGNVLVFDNGGEAGYPTQFRSFSRVMEFDPTTRAVVLNYDATRSGRLAFTLFSPFVSGAQRLPNGNTLAVEGLKGRLFEFTPTGELVWEYMTPFFGVFTLPPDLTVQVPGIYRAYRLPSSWAVDEEKRVR